MKNPIFKYPILAIFGTSLMIASLLSLISPMGPAQPYIPSIQRSVASTPSESAKNNEAVKNENPATNTDNKASSPDPVRKLPKYTEFSLGEFDPSLSQVRVKAAISTEQQKAIYNLEGDICSTCIGLIEVPIAPGELENLEFLKRQLAKSALEQIRAQKPVDSKKSTKSHPNRLESPLCDQELEDGKLSCLREGLLEMSSQCESLKEQAEDNKKQNSSEVREQKKSVTECRRQVLQFYRKEVRPSLSRGLSFPSGSELYNESLETLSDLMRDLPSSFDAAIRKDLLSLSQQSALTKTYQSLELAKSLGATPGYAATLAKQQLAFEMNHYSPMSLGGTLWRSLQEYATDSKTMTSQQALLSYQQLFYQPLFKFWSEDHRNGLSPIQAFPTLLQPELSLEQQLEMGPLTPNNSSALQGLPSVPGLQQQNGIPQGTGPSSNFGASAFPAGSGNTLAPLGHGTSLNQQVPTAPGQSQLSPGAASRRQQNRRITAP